MKHLPVAVVINIARIISTNTLRNLQLIRGLIAFTPSNFLVRYMYSVFKPAINNYGTTNIKIRER